MSCQICQLKIDDGEEVVVNFTSRTTRQLSRTFTICPKCACCFVELFVKADPVNKRCNKEAK